MMNEAVRTGRERRVVQMPMRVLRQCLRFALYLSIKSVRMWLPQQYVPSSKLLEIVEPWRRGLGGCSIPDRVTSSQSDPLRNRSVLLLGSGELLLRAEGLVALLNASSASILQILFGIPSIHAPVECLFHQPVHGTRLFSRVQSRGKRTGIVTIVVVSSILRFFVRSGKLTEYSLWA